MSRYYTNTTNLLAGLVARATDVEAEMDSVESGTDLIEAEIDQAVRLTNADIKTTQEITEPAASRANKVVGFGSTGSLGLSNAAFEYRGDWATPIVYYVNDVIRDAAGAVGLNNLYVCIANHTSTTLAADTAYWDLAVDVTDVEAAKVAAETAETGALAAQTATEAVYDAFDDRYLGSKASDPILDNDGNALIDGALYHNNTGTPQMKFYDLGTVSWLNMVESLFPNITTPVTPTSADINQLANNTFDSNWFYIRPTTGTGAYVYIEPNTEANASIILRDVGATTYGASIYLDPLVDRLILEIEDGFGATAAELRLEQSGVINATVGELQEAGVRVATVDTNWLLSDITDITATTAEVNQLNGNSFDAPVSIAPAATGADLSLTSQSPHNPALYMRPAGSTVGYITASSTSFRIWGINPGTALTTAKLDIDVVNGISDFSLGELREGGVRVAKSAGTTGGSASAGAGNQYVELVIQGVTYKVLHDGTI